MTCDIIVFAPPVSMYGFQPFARRHKMLRVNTPGLGYMLYSLN